MDPQGEASYATRSASPRQWQGQPELAPPATFCGNEDSETVFTYYSYKRRI